MRCRQDLKKNTIEETAVPSVKTSNTDAVYKNKNKRLLQLSCPIVLPNPLSCSVMNKICLNQYCVVRISAGFVTNPTVNRSSGLSGGEVTAAVFGFLALFALFGALVYIIIKPPEQLQPYILPGTTHSSYIRPTYNEMKLQQFHHSEN